MVFHRDYLHTCFIYQEAVHPYKRSQGDPRQRVTRPGSSNGRTLHPPHLSILLHPRKQKYSFEAVLATRVCFSWYLYLHIGPATCECRRTSFNSDFKNSKSYKLCPITKQSSLCFEAQQPSWHSDMVAPASTLQNASVTRHIQNLQMQSARTH